MELNNVREKLMILLTKSEKYTVLIKGGSAIDLFVNFNRSSGDIDMVMDVNSVEPVLKRLKLRGVSIITPLTEELFKKRVLKLKVKYFGKTIELNINTAFEEEYLRYWKTKSMFDILGTSVKTKHGYVLVFTKSMLLAEKYYSIITKPEESTRAKDLIDIKLLTSLDNIDYEKVWAWMRIKAASSKKQNNNSLFSIIQNNRKKQLIKIKRFFRGVADNFKVEFTFDECLDAYNEVTKELECFWDWQLEKEVVERINQKKVIVGY